MNAKNDACDSCRPKQQPGFYRIWLPHGACQNIATRLALGSVRRGFIPSLCIPRFIHHVKTLLNPLIWIKLRMNAVNNYSNRQPSTIYIVSFQG